VNRPSFSIRKRRLERWLAVAAVAGLVLAWWYGSQRADRDLEPYLNHVLPAAGSFEPLGDDAYVGLSGSENSSPIGYVKIAHGDGYGGPLRVAVAVDLDGRIVGITVVEQRETPSYLRKVLSGRFLSTLLGRSPADTFVVGEDVDAVTGATRTVSAIVEAASRGSRELATEQLALEMPPPPETQAVLALPEVTLAALFLLGFFGPRSAPRYQKWIRRSSLIAGLLLLGFVFNRPLSLAFVNRLLLGYWPQWQTHLYWYLLVVGILIVILVDTRNPYCDWFCPFGAAQECLAAIGGAHSKIPVGATEALRWTQRGVAWLAIVLALVFRNPGISSFEVFGALFEFVGSRLQFLLLAMVLVIALFVRRPWCNLLCPLRPVTDLVRLLRTWLKEPWQKAK
jgi:hypothetical protein